MPGRPLVGPAGGHPFEVEAAARQIPLGVPGDDAHLVRLAGLDLRGGGRLPRAVSEAARSAADGGSQGQLILSARAVGAEPGQGYPGTSVRSGKRKARQPVARPRVSVERRRLRHAPVSVNSGSRPGTGLPAGAAGGRPSSRWRGLSGSSWRSFFGFGCLVGAGRRSSWPPRSACLHLSVRSPIRLQPICRALSVGAARQVRLERLWRVVGSGRLDLN